MSSSHKDVVRCSVRITMTPLCVELMTTRARADLKFVATVDLDQHQRCGGA
jgi:hypothetical protein